MDSKIEEGRALKKISSEEAQKLKKKADEFNHTFQSEQDKFQSSSDEIYFIVSTQYLEQWREYC